MKLRKGMSFDFSGPVDLVDGAGDPVDMSTWTPEAQVFFPEEKLTIDLTAEWIGDSFTHIRLKGGDTSDWPSGPADLLLSFESQAGDRVGPLPKRFCVV